MLFACIAKSPARKSPLLHFRKDNPMLRRSLAVAAVVMLVFVIGGSSLSSGADPAAKTNEPDFSGKVIYVETSDKSQPMYMEGVKVRTLGGRVFLVGTYGKHASFGDIPDVVYWIPVDQARVLMEFKNMDDAFKMATSRKNVDR
jgi:hypothetical protein